MPARLVALTAGPDILVSHAPVVVGRHPLCDAWIGPLLVSRRHCCLAEAAGVVVVRDLGSTNGVRINGRRVESGQMRPGDELSIAHVRYRLERTPEDWTDPAATYRGPVPTYPENRAAI